MTTPLRSLTLAASAALALAAAPRARACEMERGFVPPPQPAPPPAAVVPAPAYFPPAYAPAAPLPFERERWHGDARVRELRHESARLERARDQYYARWGGNPWATRRFEAWYQGRRAELDRRLAELAGYAG